MTLSAHATKFPYELTTDDARALAKGLGLTIPEENLPEVTHRFTALMHEFNKLRGTDLSSVNPAPTFAN